MNSSSYSTMADFFVRILYSCFIAVWLNLVILSAVQFLRPVIRCCTMLRRRIIMFLDTSVFWNVVFFCNRKSLRFLCLTDGSYGFRCPTDLSTSSAFTFVLCLSYILSSYPLFRFCFHFCFCFFIVISFTIVFSQYSQELTNCFPSIFRFFLLFLSCNQWTEFWGFLQNNCFSFF